MSQDVYRCDECNKQFLSQKEMQEHNKKAHIETVGKKE